MADKGQKGTDKLSEALRRAEEAILKDGKLRDEEVKKEKEKKIRKPMDLDDVLFDEPRKQKQPKKPIEPPKQNKEKPPKPEAAKKKPGSHPPPNLSFGELDLSRASADAPKLELDTEEEKSAAMPAEKRPPKPPKAEPTEAKPAEQERPRRRKDPDEYVPYVPRSSFARKIKIALIVLLVLAAIGGGVFGFLKWRESVEADEAAEKAKIENSSRDSLMDDSFKKEKFK